MRVGRRRSLKLQNIEFSGKTGTAQVIGYDTREPPGEAEEFKDNGWFVGYAPRRNPEIAVAALVQGGGHGASVGAPVRDIVKAYYDKKQQREQQSQTAREKTGGSGALVATLEGR